MQQIDDLRLEIESFEDEIQKLQQELSANFQIAPKAVSNSPEAIADAFRSAAVATHERIADIQAIRGAIAELTDRLQPKKIQLGELEAQQLRQHRIERIEEGRSRLRAKFANIEEAAESLKTLFFELKMVAQEYERDFAEINPPTSGGTALNRNSLLNYEVLALPTITEENQRFILNSRFINLFEAEKEALKRQRLEQSLSYRADREREWLKIKERETEERSRIEQEERQLLLSSKQSELAEFKAARTERLSSLASANVDGFDSAIASLEAEIQNLQQGDLQVFS